MEALFDAAGHHDLKEEFSAFLPCDLEIGSTLHALFCTCLLPTARCIALQSTSLSRARCNARRKLQPKPKIKPRRRKDAKTVGVAAAAPAMPVSAASAPTLATVAPTAARLEVLPVVKRVKHAEPTSA
eukprot:SAG11_NODE_1621_length_4562_cov_2.009187_5_plen_128_part_00